MFHVGRFIFGFNVILSISAGTIVQAYELAGGAEDGEIDGLSAAIAEVTTRDARFEQAQPVSALSTAGFIDNGRLLRDGEVQFALIDSVTAYGLTKGQGPFAGDAAFQDLSVVATLWYDVDHFIIDRSAAASGTVADFGNATGPLVSLSDEKATQVNANQQVLQQLGVEVGIVVDRDAVTGPESVQRLDYQGIGGLGVSVPAPSESVREAISSMGAGGVLLNLTSGQFARLAGSREGAWTSYSIPAGTYPGQDTDIDTTARAVMLVARSDVSEEDVHQFTEAFFGNLENVQARSVLADRIDLANAVPDDTAFPLHPGAARYFQEVGLLTGNDVFERLQTNQDPLARRDSTIDPWKAYRPLQSIVFSGEPDAGRSRTFVSFFAFNSIDLDEAAEIAVADAADFGKRAGGAAEIDLAGHADRAGPADVNEKVALRRANTVAQQLVALGYDENLITSRGFGESRPAVSTADEEKHLQNRRVELTVAAPAEAAVAALEPQGTDVETDDRAADRDAPAAETDGLESAKASERSGLPSLLIDNVVGEEQDDSIMIDLELSQPHDSPLAFVVTLHSGTATAGDDFEDKVNVVTMNTGDTRAQVPIAMVDDDLVEGDEIFVLQISSDPRKVDIPQQGVTVTIKDDD